MKLQAITIKVGLVLVLAVFGVGCAKKSDGGGSSSDTVTNTGTGPTTPRDAESDRGADWASGTTTELTMDSTAALNYYVGSRPVNNPTDLRISVKLENKGSSTVGYNKYTGFVMVSYLDNGSYHTGRFYTYDKSNPSTGTIYPNWHHASYNTWFTDPRTGKLSFHGFYQDQYGAVMIIIDNMIDQGDGAGANSASGSIWFKNFANSTTTDCQGATTNCRTIWDVPGWFRTTGQYDVRTFLVSGNNGDGNISTKSVLYPSESLYYTSYANNPWVPQEPARGWRRLGTFGNLNKATAFTQ